MRKDFSDNEMPAMANQHHQVKMNMDMLLGELSDIKAQHCIGR